MRKVIRPWPEAWLREALESELMHPLTDRQWQYLVENTDHIRDAQAGMLSYSAKDTGVAPSLAFGTGQPVNLRELAARVRQELQDLGVKPPRPVRPPEVLIPRARAHMDALSQITAARVAKRDEVRQVRTSKLKGKRAIAAADELAARLAKETGWTLGEARAFLSWPPTSRDWIGMLPVSDRPRTGRYMTLSVDPIVSPQELARAYSEMRRAVVGDARVRRLSPKHLGLAVFMAEQPDTARPMWDSRRVAWNARAPKKWRYGATDLTNFARDCVAAQRRMEARSG